MSFVCFSYVQNRYTYIFASFSVARVSNDDEAKLSRERRRSVLGGIQGNGYGGGVAVVGKQRLTKAGRRRQTG